MFAYLAEASIPGLVFSNLSFESTKSKEERLLVGETLLMIFYHQYGSCSMLKQEVLELDL